MAVNEPIRIAIAGLGKIARDRHIPALARNARFHLGATIDPVGDGIAGLEHFASVAALLDSGCAIDAVAICTPPQQRFAVASTALTVGKHILLEKPPAATLGEVESLKKLAILHAVTVFAAWHSRFAPGVNLAREWLTGKQIKKVQIVWKEDVQIWHPGQDWIWRPGGFGVFDPGINALSILTAILPNILHVNASRLQYPANLDAPVAAQLMLEDEAGLSIVADFDFRQSGKQTWDIEFATDQGALVLQDGGATLVTPGQRIELADTEYEHIYARFADLIDKQECDVDCAPLRLVADAFMCGHASHVKALHI